MIFDKWVMAAFVYVGVLIGGFSLYEKYYDNDSQAVSASEHDSHEKIQSILDENHKEVKQNDHSHEHGSSSAQKNTSEVNVFIQTNIDEIKIFLRDKTGNPVTDLEFNHEKLLHLIIVDEHLEKYYHLHPEQSGNGEFSVHHKLPEGFYKAFIDIKPKHSAYHVTPVPFIVGNPNGFTHTHGEDLKADHNLTKTVDGETVKLNLSSQHANQPVSLTFDLNKTNLTPYLGAMGHVVILDENAQNFLHVHPAHDEEAIFETEFKQPGLYKIFAEFKQNGKVRVFPFVVEIKGENL